VSSPSAPTTNAAFFGFLIIFFVLPLALPVAYGLVGLGNAWRRNRDARHRPGSATPPSASYADGEGVGVGDATTSVPPISPRIAESAGIELCPSRGTTIQLGPTSMAEIPRSSIRLSSP
jgi:hypothetical protein